MVWTLPSFEHTRSAGCRVRLFLRGSSLRIPCSHRQDPELTSLERRPGELTVKQLDTAEIGRVSWRSVSFLEGDAGVVILGVTKARNRVVSLEPTT